MQDSRSTTIAEAEIFEALRAMLPVASFNTWFSNASVDSLTENEIVIGAANRFVKAWLENHYRDIIAEAAKSVTGTKPEVSVVISRQKYKEQIQVQVTDSQPAAPAPQTVAGTDLASQPLFRRSQHTFDNFTEGSCNRFALAAARQAVDNPGEYSPLYLFGGHGLGKTHLLHAVCSEVSRRNPAYKVLCINPDYFVQSYSAAYMNNRLPEFKKRYEECDLLAIDDFQNFSHGKKTASQKELIAILDNMQHRNRQVIIAACGAVHTLEGLDPMLASRLGGGLQARLDTPDDLTRRSIITNKSENISDEVASLISERTSGSIREIEGLVKTVSAMAKITGVVPDLSDVEQLLAPKAIEKPGIEKISRTVAEVFQIPLADIRGKKRQGSIAQARRVSIHLVRELSGCSLNEIGNFFGNRKHSTIINILKNGIGSKNPVLCNKINDTLKSLNQKIKAEKLFSSQAEIF